MPLGAVPAAIFEPSLSPTYTWTAYSDWVRPPRRFGDMGVRSDAIVGTVTVRRLEPDDVGWAAELMEDRRQEYAQYSPVFWRPRSGATGIHAGHLRQQALDPGNVAIRNDHGFLIVQPRGEEGLVDDFAVDAGGSWAEAGRELLHGAWDRLAARGAAALRVVTARADRTKVEMLVSSGLVLAEQWWVTPLEANGSAAAPGRITGTSFSGVLGPAPPVYDPGGLVLLVDRDAVDAGPALIERDAAAAGAVLAVLPTEPADDREHELRQRGWEVASQWYLGRPELDGSTVSEG